MQTIRVGCGRLYNANGCSNLGRNEILISFPLGSITVEAYIGTNPRHNVLTWKVEPPRPQDLTTQKTISNMRGYVFPSPEKFPADFYMELVAVQGIEVDDDLASAFNARDMPARDEILRIAEDHRSSFTRALDCVAGILGLRLHYRLVTTPITEQLYAYRDPGNPYSLSTGLPVTIIESCVLDVSDEGLQTIRRKMPQLKGKWTLEKAAEILAWLLRAWAAEDPVVRFVSLFIPLECVVPNVPPAEKNAWDQDRRTLLALVHREPTTNEISKLTNFVAKLRFPPPSIVSRFETWATEAAMLGWEEDIAAFKQFQKMRNLLVHAGRKVIDPRITVGANDVRTLEDIAERYVSLALFGDADVYQSRKRSASQ